MYACIKSKISIFFKAIQDSEKASNIFYSFACLRQHSDFFVLQQIRRLRCFLNNGDSFDFYRIFCRIAGSEVEGKETSLILFSIGRLPIYFTRYVWFSVFHKLRVKECFNVCNTCTAFIIFHKPNLTLMQMQCGIVNMNTSIHALKLHLFSLKILVVFLALSLRVFVLLLPM